MGMGTRARRTKRIMESSLGDFIRECQGAESDRENFRRNWSGGFGYRNDINEWGQPSGVVYVTTPLGTHRDADARTESNWSVIEREMEKAESFGHISEHPGNMTHTEGSCLNGWNESVMIRVDDAVSVKAAMDIVNALSDYPVLDEEDYSEREWEANHPDGYNCYAEEGCDCADGEHARKNEEEDHAGCRAWLLGKLRNSDGEGWRTFGSSDVTEEYEELDDDTDPEYVANLTYWENDSTFYIEQREHNRLVSWQWYCGADGCGTWIDATTDDLREIVKHHLFSDIPVPAKPRQIALF